VTFRDQIPEISQPGFRGFQIVFVFFVQKSDFSKNGIQVQYSKKAKSWPNSAQKGPFSDVITVGPRIPGIPGFQFPTEKYIY